VIVLDITNLGTEKIVSYTWKFSFIYTLFLLLGIFAGVAYLHFRYIRSSLKNFRATIAKINHGDLEARLIIPEAKELGSLGKSFNDMLDTFEKTQKELQVYHQQELQTSQKLATIGEMSARIAHEIRNPITGIARAMEIIIAESKDDADKPVLEEIQRQANRVELAISNLLKYSRSQEVRLHEGDVNVVIRSMVFFLRHQAYDKQVVFDTDLQSDIPPVMVDHELLENVLMNLSFNAVKSITEPGIILFSTRYEPAESSVIIAIQDNGTGIPDHARDEIFKPFFTTHTKGTGLGLAISKDIIDKHNGKIWFENNRVAGCTFFISLPGQKPA
jgi:signal transduction histidine kinase